MEDAQVGRAYAVEDALSRDSSASSCDLVAQPPSWAALPDGIELAPGVDLTLADPALLDSGKRQCIAARKAGGRCGGPATRDRLICAVHAGLADPAAGGRAKAAIRKATLVAAEERVVERRMGVRAALSAQLQRRLDAVEAAVDLLLDTASDSSLPRAERLRSAQALLPWLDQALGKVAPSDTTQPAPTALLSQLSTEELAALVAEGRAKRHLRPA